MKRHINFTQRRHLERSHLGISLLAPLAAGARERFSMRLDVPPEWKLPPDARVYVEPYVNSTSMRFDFGTLAATVPPSDTALTGVDDGRVLFRVKIVDESKAVGLLLASADEVQPRGLDENEAEEEGPGQRSILPLRLRDLGNQIWLVEITAGGGPELVINNRLPGLRERLLQEPFLQGMVFPAALRYVLGVAFGEGVHGDEKWIEDWYQFAGKLGVPELAEPDQELDEETRAELIEKTVERFCDNKRFGELARLILEGEASA